MNTKIRQRPISKWKENALAVFFALILSWWVYFLWEYSGVLTADVVWWPQAEFNVYSDIVVAPKWEDAISVFAWKNMEDVETISMILLFDPSSMQLDADVFSSRMNHSYSSAGVWKWTLILTNTKNTSFSVRDNLVDIDAPWSFLDLVVWDVVATFADGTTETLSVELPK